MSDPTPLGPIAFGILQGGTGVSSAVKQAILDCFEHAAWADDQGPTYYNALLNAFYPLDHITAVYTQSGTVYDTDSLDSLKTDLVVTAVYESGETKTIDAADYTLSGMLTVGTSTITVSYAGKTTTFTVTVTQSILPAGYQLVEWIEAERKDGDNYGNDGAYIETDKTFSGAGNVVVNVTAAQTGTTPNPAAIFGCRKANDTGNNNGFNITYSTNSVNEVDIINAFAGFAAAVYPNGQGNSILNEFFDIEATVDRANGSITASAGGVTTTSSGTVRDFFGTTIYVFAGYTNRVVYCANAKMKYFKITENNTVLLELYPCYRMSDSAVGMYDIQNSKFYTSAGSVAFTKGADVR